MSNKKIVNDKIRRKIFLQSNDFSGKYIYLVGGLRMILKSKKKYSLIILLLCCITLVSCGQENTSKNKLDISKEENNYTRTPGIIENSSLPMQNRKNQRIAIIQKVGKQI